MNEQSCDVSIVCANYNNGKYLHEFISSVINSTFLPKELIIVDDGSTDESKEILQTYKLPYLKVIGLGRNEGFANALNHGINEATSKYILRVDPDDILDKKRIEKQFMFLESNCGIDLIGSNVVYFNENLFNVVGSSNFPEEGPDIYKRYVNGEHGLLHGTVMGKSTFFKKHLYRQNNVPAEDYDIFSRMMEDGAKAQNSLEKLTFVRIHVNSVSNSLPFSTVKMTYQLRDEIFKSKTPFVKIIINYLSLRYYRKFYFEKQLLKRVVFLGISSAFRPDKVIRKFFG
ncbi:hypothetical protein BKM32_03900 [Mangrovimonas sp. DI 80]|nr:hypothetical protein BKM32_03900 [Mangrovimonas sp. DI 80]